MKITDITTTLVNAGMRNWVFVRVDTDVPGLYGLGEATLEWKTRAVVGAIEDLKPLLIGRDPRDIERCHQTMVKHSFWRLGVIGMTAVSGIDIALWDISAKDLGVPVWRLLGGRTRDAVHVYAHLGLGDMTSVYQSLSSASVVERALQVIEAGYDALKVVCVPYTHYTATPRDIDQVGRIMGDLRAAVGRDVEIMVDFHGRPASVSAALAYIDALAPHRPMFVEEPIGPADTVALVEIARRSPVPIACGERLPDKHAFQDLFAHRAVAIAQPDICHVGGFTEARKVAAMAEAVGVGLAPHNPLGPIAGVAALHFAVAAHNFVIQEEMSGAVPWFSEVVLGPINRVGSYWQVPEAPGLGVTIDASIASRYPFVQEDTGILTQHAILNDGTVVDW
jgi:galactonate dehydratase